MMITTEGGSHWLAIQIEPRSSITFYFDSYGLPSFVPAIQSFLRRTCTIWEYNRSQLQGLTTTVCGDCCCLFALYMDRNYTPKDFITLFDTQHADQQVREMCQSEFENLSPPLPLWASQHMERMASAVPPRSCGKFDFFPGTGSGNQTYHFAKKKINSQIFFRRINQL
jgi:hypothetical protein